MIEVQTDVSLTVEGHVWVKTVLLSKAAFPPCKREENSAEIILKCPETFYVRPKSGRGVKTDVSLELPPGVYGKVLSSPAARVNGWARVEDLTIDPCMKQNITIFVYNCTKDPGVIERGEVLAEVIVL